MFMSKGKKIKVLIVDDHAVVRSGLAAFLLSEDNLELIGEVNCGEDAVKVSAELKPDVILMDLVMPNMDGATATKVIKEKYPQIEVIALTSFPEGELVQKALEAGAISYLLKNVSSEKLAQAIRDAYHGEATLAPEAAKALIKANSQSTKLGKDLTPRELDVLELMVKGLSNKELAEQLIVSQSTIKFHVSNIISKLEAASRTEAVVLALQHNIIS